MKKRFALIFISLFITACSTTPPNKPHNLCDIFKEKSSWYEPAKEAARDWGTWLPGMMSIMYHESSYIHDARPPKKYTFFGLIPNGRISSAYGYSQALDGTWEHYQKNTGKWWTDRDEFEDAIDFIGWYLGQNQRNLKIARTNAANHYLAYHEGPGGFKRKTYKKKKWLVKKSKKVQKKAKEYEKQLKSCSL